MTGRFHKDIRAKDIEWLLTDAGARTFTMPLDDSDPSAPVIVLAHFPPGFFYAPHTHGCNYAEYVVSGKITVGKQSYLPGDLRIVAAGGGYGPLMVGEEGCHVVIVFSNGDQSAVELLPRARAAAGVREGMQP